MHLNTPCYYVRGGGPLLTRVSYCELHTFQNLKGKTIKLISSQKIGYIIHIYLITILSEVLALDPYLVATKSLGSKSVIHIWMWRHAESQEA